MSAVTTIKPNADGMCPMYVTKPLASLLGAWKVKLPVAVMLAGVWEALRPLLGIYETLLTADPVLVVMVGTLIFTDFVTGIARSLRDGKAITSRRLRGMGWKIVEYTVVASLGVMLANGAAETVLAAPLALADDAALLYVALTEAVSILENVTGSKARAHGIIDSIRQIMKGKLPKSTDSNQ